jgi:hypothetical protein
MSQADTAVFWARQQEISLTSKLCSHIYTAALFLLFVLEQVLQEKKLWFTFFQKFTNSLLISFPLDKEEERKNYNKSSVFVLDYQQTIKNIPLICFIKIFCFPMSVSLSCQ